ncbi:hypothetical protein C8R43DRAFT_189906 [Mycena crocata]|nr:hypothetical protein C8R43DRAFT_189906 [Mycena crocata]
MSILRADRVRVARLEAQILALGPQPERYKVRLLQNEKDWLQGRLDSYKYRVLTLPNEIISEIFTHFLPVYPLCPPLTGLLSPTTLACICHKWREIVLSTPSLWRAISFSDGDKTLPALENIVNSWLCRSGSCPLSIQIHFLNGSGMNKIIDPIIQYRSRWEHMDFFLQLPAHLLAIEGPMPSLRGLDIRVVYPISTSSVHFNEAPLLRAATLASFTPPTAFLPWSQLTSLTLKYMRVSVCAQILAQTPNLVHCTLSVWNDKPPYPDMKLECLESLALIRTNSSMKPLTEYFASFILPALHTLQISEYFLGMEPIQALAAFITKAGCKLQEVHLTGKIKHRNEYHDAFPSIARIRFNAGTPYEDSDSEVESD